MKQLIALMLGLSLSACVTIESPKNLVSDTINAGKDLYKEIKNDKKAEDAEEAKPEVADTESVVTTDDKTITANEKTVAIVESEAKNETTGIADNAVIEEESESSVTVFTHIYPIQEKQSDIAAMQACIETVTEIGRKALNKYTLNIDTKTFTTKQIEGESFVECEIAVSQ